MLVKIQNSKITAVSNISDDIKEQEFLASNPTYIKTDFNFVEAVDLYEYDGNTFNLIADWEAIKDARINALKPTFEELQAQKLAELKSFIDAQYNAYISKYPEVEVESFKDKARESALVIADNNVDMSLTPYLAKLSQGDVIARLAVAQAVDAKVAENALLEATGVQLRDAIKLATTVEELEAIGW